MESRGLLPLAKDAPVYSATTGSNGDITTTESLRDSKIEERGCLEHISIGDSSCGSQQNEGNALVDAVGTSDSESQPPRLERDAVHFGIRMATCLTIASLFVLVQDPDDGKAAYPQGMWVLITVLFVCWFPKLDAASVVEKSIQRLIGTLIGAALGLLCGFVSLVMTGQNDESGTAQACFVGGCIAIVTFVVCTAAVQLRVGNKKIISRYNYAVILCLLTFTICLIPFYSDEGDKKWRKALYRVVNVIVGCILGAGLSILVLPRSTASIMRKNISKQVRWAGEASEVVLHTASDYFSESAFVPLSLTDEMIGSDEQQQGFRRQLTISHRPWRRHHSGTVDRGGNIALEKYESAIKDWRITQSQFSMLKYDPFNIGTPDGVLATMRTEMANALARALRIQTTVVLLDGIVRNDPKHDFSEDHLKIFADIGTLIRQMLTVPLKIDHNDRAANDLTSKLSRVREYIIELSSVVATSPKETPAKDLGMCEAGILSSRVNLAVMLGDIAEADDSWQFHEDDNGGRGAPKHVHGSRVCALLFLQLVEHLALRSVRLYQSWKRCESICQDVETLDHKNKGRRFSRMKWKGS